MYRSSVINIDESELKTIPKILMEISAAKVKTLLEESVTCKANFFRMVVLFEATYVSSDQSFRFIAGECKASVQLLVLLGLLPEKLLKIL